MFQQSVDSVAGQKKPWRKATKDLLHWFKNNPGKVERVDLIFKEYTACQDKLNKKDDIVRTFNNVKFTISGIRLKMIDDEISK